MKRSLFGLLAGVFFLLVSQGSLNAQPDGTYDRALYYYKRGDFNRVVELLEGYLRRTPEPSASYLMGYALYKLGRHQEAERYFRDAYLLEPDFRPERIDFSRARP